MANLSDKIEGSLIFTTCSGPLQPGVLATPQAVCVQSPTTSPSVNSSRKRRRLDSFHENGTVSSRHGSMTDGTDNAREIVDISDLTCASVVQDTVESYFTYCHHQPYSFFHRGNFMERLAMNQIPSHLLFAVQANGARYSSHPLIKHRAHDCAVTYVDYAWQSIISNFFEKSLPPDLSVVQAVALISIFDFTRNVSPSIFRQ